MPNHKHNMQSKNYIKSSKLYEKYTAESAKIYLNSDMETIRNRSIMKIKGQIQNFRKNVGDLKNSKQNLKYNFMF